MNEYFEANIVYETAKPYNLISLPKEITVKNHSGSVLRKRSATFNSQGKMTSVVQYNTGDSSQVDLRYDGYGNVVRMTLPPNASNQPMEYRYTYDPLVHQYPVRVESVLGYYSTAEYDYRYGKPLKTVDVNGQEMRYTYDRFGRTSVVLAPLELEAGVPYTVKMSYAPVNYHSLNASTAAVHSYATTEHYDAQHPLNPMVTTVLCDGWGRAVQTKKEAQIGGNEVSMVSGKMGYDCFGRAVAQYPLQSHWP